MTSCGTPTLAAELQLGLGPDALRNDCRPRVSMCSLYITRHGQARRQWRRARSGRFPDCFVSAGQGEKGG